MNKLLTTTALVGALAFAAPAVAGTDVVLNGQLNLGSPTTAIGVVGLAKKITVDVTNIDVTAVGNLNETVANGGGSTFDLTKKSSSSKERSGSSFEVSYESSVSVGRHYSAERSLSISGSAWSSTRSRSSKFSISSTRRNSVFVGSLQANVGSPTTAIGVAGVAKKLSVSAKNLTVQAVGNMNSTKLK